MQRTRLLFASILCLLSLGILETKAQDPFPGVPALDVLLQQKTSKKLRPVFVARSRGSGQLAVLTGRHSIKVSAPIRPHTLTLFDPAAPENVLQIAFSRAGDPVRIKTSDGSKIEFKIVKSTGFVRAIYRDRRNRVLARDDEFAPLTVTVPASIGRVAALSPKPEYHTPWQIHPDQSATTQEVVAGAGADGVRPISDLLNLLSESANDYLSRARSLALSSAAGGVKLGQALGYFLSDTFSVFAETTGSFAMRVVSTIYDLARDVKRVADYVRKPTVPTLAGALEKAASLANQATDGVESVTALIDENDEIADIDDPTKGGGGGGGAGSDMEKRDQVVMFSDNLLTALDGIGDSFALGDYTIGGIALPIIVERRAHYFAAMSLFTQQCSNVADISGTIRAGTSLRNQAKGKVLDLRQKLIDAVTAERAKVQAKRDENLESLAMQNETIASQNAYIVTLQNAGMPQFLIDAAIAARDDMIAQGQIFVANLDACDALKLELDSVKAQLQAIVVP